MTNAGTHRLLGFGLASLALKLGQSAAIDPGRSTPN